MCAGTKITRDIHMKVYIDILFIQYFIMNFFLIEMTSIFLREKSKIRYECLSASIVSLYSIIAVIINMKFLFGALSKIILSIVIVLITFKYENIGDVIKKSISLHIITYLLGGILLSMMNDVNNQSMAIVISLICCICLVLIIKEIFKNIFSREKFSCDVRIIINEKDIIVKAFIDTGNKLKDVVTGDEVMIINENKIAEFSRELFDALRGIMLEIPDEYQTKIRMITYNSIGNQDDVLYGIKADSVIVYYDGKEIENKNVVVAICEDEIKKFDAIISLDLIERGHCVGDSFIIKTKGKKVVDKSTDYT